jgi:hypothetical protein
MLEPLFSKVIHVFALSAVECSFSDLVVAAILKNAFGSLALVQYSRGLIGAVSVFRHGLVIGTARLTFQSVSIQGVIPVSLV